MWSQLGAMITTDRVYTNRSDRSLLVSIRFYCNRDDMKSSSMWATNSPDNRIEIPNKEVRIATYSLASQEAVEIETAAGGSDVSVAVHHVL